MGATRRTFLATLATSALHGQPEKGKAFPSEWKRYSDPATEFEVTRLTDPAHSSQFPAYYNRALSRRNEVIHRLGPGLWITVGGRRGPPPRRS